MNRVYRRCETCEYADEGWGGSSRVTCHHIDRLDDTSSNPKNYWCSEWKSAIVETCADCHWFDEQYSNCTHSKGPTKHVYAATGACDNIRRVE